MTQRRHNAGIKKRPAFYVGDRVWIMKPKPVGGHNIQTYWTGPTTITSRTGASSFKITTANGDTRAVHISQIKPYQDDVLEGGAPCTSTDQDTEKPPLRLQRYMKYCLTV
jgi:hypothetical protein